MMGGTNIEFFLSSRRKCLQIVKVSAYFKILEDVPTTTAVWGEKFE